MGIPTNKTDAYQFLVNVTDYLLQHQDTGYALKIISQTRSRLFREVSGNASE